MGLVAAAATVVRRVQKVVPSAFITIKMAACFCREEGNYGEGVLALLDCFARLERGKGGVKELYGILVYEKTNSGEIGRKNARVTKMCREL